MYQGLAFQPSYFRIALARAAARAGRRRLGGSLRLEAFPEPDRHPGDAPWVNLAPIMSGICGSDLAVIFGRSSPYLAPLASFPAVMGHEIVARVVTASGRLAPGQRVVVDPSLGCLARRPEDACSACAAGHPEACRRRGDADTGPGLLLGYHRTWPGGWATRTWAPEDQCWPLPRALPTPRAVLSEPLATVLSGLSRIRAPRGARFAVIGAGTLGLLAVWAVRTDFDPALIHTAARYPHQAAWVERLGGVALGPAGFSAPSAGSVLGTPSQNPLFGAPPFYPEGYDVVVDAVGSSASVRASLSLVRPGGQILLLGGAGPTAVDLSPLWSRGVTWVGAFGYRTADGSSLFPEAIRRLAETDLPLENLVTHRFPLTSFRAALRLWMRREFHIKAVFLPGEPDGHAVPCRVPGQELREEL